MGRLGITVTVIVGVLVIILAFVIAWHTRSVSPQSETATNESASSPEVKPTTSALLSKETVKQTDASRVPPIPQPPKVTKGQDTKVIVDALIARNDDASNKKLVEMHETGDDITRREVERNAADKNPGLKKSIVDESVMALDNKDAGIQVKALETLRFLADPSGTNKAVGLLSSEKPPEVIAGSINYLGRVNNQDGFEKVLLLAKTSKDIGVRATAIRNLVLTGGKAHPAETVAVLEEALSSADIPIQAEALRALGYFPQNISTNGKKRITELADIGATDRKKEEIRETARVLLNLIENVEGIGAE